MKFPSYWHFALLSIACLVCASGCRSSYVSTVSAPDPTSHLASIPAGTQVMTNEDVIQMSQSGLSDSVILNSVQSQPAAFDTSPTAIVAMQHAGVSDGVIQAVQQREASAQSATLPAAYTPTEVISPPPTRTTVVHVTPPRPTFVIAPPPRRSVVVVAPRRRFRSGFYFHHHHHCD